MNNYRLGIDIGGTNIKYLLSDKDYNIIDKWSVPTQHFNHYNGFYDYLCENISSKYKIDIIGVSSPGLIDINSCVKSLASEKVKIMYNTNINEEINIRINIKTASINDAKAAGLCELKLGNARDTSSSAFLIIGTGIGGCICDAQDVIYGADRFAGEFHFFSSYDPLSNKIIRQGDYASATGLINIYRNKIIREEKTLINAGEILDLYLKNEERAILSVEEWIMNISALLMNITIFYNPQVICIGGGFSEKKWLIDKLAAQYYKLCQDMKLGFLNTKIRECKFKNSANALGAILNAEREIYGKSR